MEKRERQRYDSEVLIVWCLLGLGTIIMAMLVFNYVVDIYNYFHKH
jgi:hypothetical protein